MIRVLVVDDSAFARKVVREVLSASPGIEVVGIARDGLEALEKIRELSPDVVTLDLVMPHLDGIGVLKALPRVDGPRVVAVTIAGAESSLGVAALELGAIAIVQKPTALATDRLYGLATDLVAKVTLAASARVTPLPLAAGSSSPSPLPPLGQPRIVVLGTSTGGPQALTRLIPALSADFPVPIALVVHIPPGYTEALASRLNTASALAVREASEGFVMRPGHVVVARAGIHLKLNRRADAPVVHLDAEPSNALHCPSVDVLFASAAAAFGPEVLAVVLTGMGDDGLAGSRAVRERGGRVITEAEASCVVFGMPRRVRDAGLSDAESPLSSMAAMLTRWV